MDKHIQGHWKSQPLLVAISIHTPPSTHNQKPVLFFVPSTHTYTHIHPSPTQDTLFLKSTAGSSVCLGAVIKQSAKSDKQRNVHRMCSCKWSWLKWLKMAVQRATRNWWWWERTQATWGQRQRTAIATNKEPAGGLAICAGAGQLQRQPESHYSPFHTQRVVPKMIFHSIITIHAQCLSSKGSMELGSDIQRD